MRSLALLGSGAIAACSGGPAAPVSEDTHEPPRAHKRAAPPAPLGLAEGAVWKFRGTRVHLDEGTGAERADVITWQTEVVAEERGGRGGGPRSWRVRGWPADAAALDPGQAAPGAAETTIVLHDGVLYLGADRAAPARDDAWLRWPPDDGDEVCLEDGGAYCWRVEAHGKRYTVTLRTGPDDTTYTIDPRRGVVRFEYHHHGTANDVVLERIP